MMTYTALMNQKRLKNGILRTSDPLKTQIDVCQAWKNDSWEVSGMIVWDKRKGTVWAQKQKK
jgi:hypothetical protein